MWVSSPSRASSTWKTRAVESRGRSSVQREHPEAHLRAASPNFLWKWQRGTDSTCPEGQLPRERPSRLPRLPRPPPRCGGVLDTAETVAGAAAEGDVEDAVQALSAAAATVLKSPARLPVIAVTMAGFIERRKTRLRMSSSEARARRRRSSRANSAGRSSPASVVARNVSIFASRGGSKVLQRVWRMSLYGSALRGRSKNDESFLSVTESSFERT